MTPLHSASSPSPGMPIDTPEPEDAEDEVGGWVTSSHLTQYAGKALEVREVKAKCIAFHPATKTPVTGTKVISIISKFH